jgi:hypothetical protein
MRGVRIVYLVYLGVVLAGIVYFSLVGMLGR